MITIYVGYMSAAAWLGQKLKRTVPMRMQRLVFDESGDLTTTIAWVIGLAVISGVAIALYTNVIAPGVVSATSKTNNVVNALP
ncbi:MAG: hypothetical protein ACYCU8_13435 [Ferrimicrobium acidiphilum]